MKQSLTAPKLLALAFVLTSTTVACNATAEDLPSRKAGLWQIDISMEGMDGKSPSAKHCIDAATDKQMQAMGKEMGEKMGQTCTKNSTTKSGGSYVIESDCNMAGTHIVSQSVISGDFNSKYTTGTSSSYDPPLMGRKEGKTKVTATWIGACEADQKPGDMIMPGGVKMNINQLSGMAKPQG